MLDKMKDLGSHALTKTTEAIDAVTSSVSSGIDSLNEKAVRASTAHSVYRTNILDQYSGAGKIAPQTLKLSQISRY